MKNLFCQQPSNWSSGYIRVYYSRTLFLKIIGHHPPLWGDGKKQSICNHQSRLSEESSKQTPWSSPILLKYFKFSSCKLHCVHFFEWMVILIIESQGQKRLGWSISSGYLDGWTSQGCRFRCVESNNFTWCSKCVCVCIHTKSGSKNL